MTDDDHYIANSRNAHIDTSQFERDVRALLSERGREVNDTLEAIYNLAVSRTNVAPEEPPEDQLICRYLSPLKFLQFLDTRRINFPMATQFSDHWECRIPEDYENAVLRVINDFDMTGNEWDRLVRLKAADWNISCWTQLDDYFDDHLMWHAYAGGPEGIGITVRYGILKARLASFAGQLDLDGTLRSGRVNYETLRLLPFNKHYIFRNEKEVRFAFRAFQPGPTCAPVDDIFGYFGVRVSPAATPEHHDMIKVLWRRYGGQQNRVQWPR